MQWLPYRWYFQIFFVLYRWVIALYFFGWLFAAGFYPLNGGPKFFIFITNWGFLAFNAYVIWAAIVTTIDFFREFVCCRQQYAEIGETRVLAYEHDLEAPTGCCGKDYNKICWYHMIQWVLFLFGTELAVVITILNWSLLHRPGSPISGVNFNTHGTQAIVSVIELLISGIPIRFYHFYFTPIFGGVYVIFTGIYFVAGGTNVIGRQYIYSVLNYGANPGMAVGLALGVVLGFVPVVHFVFHLVYIARYWIVYLIYGQRSTSKLQSKVMEVKSEGPEEAGTELKEM